MKFRLASERVDGLVIGEQEDNVGPRLGSINAHYRERADDPE